MQTYLAWFAVLMLGVRLTGRDLNIGAIHVSHSLWLGGLVSLIAVGGIGLHIRRDVHARRMSAPRSDTSRNDV